MQIHSQDDFWKRGTKMTTLEEQPRLMEDIGAPPPGFFFWVQRMGAPHRNQIYAFINL